MTTKLLRDVTVSMGGYTIAASTLYQKQLLDLYHAYLRQHMKTSLEVVGHKLPSAKDKNV
jgi:hypothetical protein